MEFRLDRKAVRRFKGFPPEDVEEGDAEHAAMSPDERIAAAGLMLREYVSAGLRLPEVPRLDRSKVRVVRRGDVAE